MNLSLLEFVECVHGNAEDSCIRIAAKPNGKFDSLGSIKARQARELLPQIEPHLQLNGYVSINSYYQASEKTNSKTGLPIAAGHRGNLQWLTGIYADIDTGRSGLSKDDPRSENTQDAMYRALENCDKHGFPQPTLFAESGQGFYFFWAFKESLRAWLENIEQVENAQRALGFIHAAKDTSAVDATRVLRAPGTIHSKTGQATTWRPGANGPTRYESEELCGRLGIRGKQSHQIAVKRPGSCPAHRAGLVMMNSYRASDLRALHKHRDGFQEGTRRYALTLYAVARLSEGATPLELSPELETMAAECQPPYPSHANDFKAHEILRGAMRLKKAQKHRTNQKIIERLGITDEEAKTLNLKTLTPDVAEKSRQAHASRVLNEGRPNRATRFEFVKSYLREQPTASVREVHAATQAAGIKASRGTVHTDMASLRAPNSQ